MKKLILSIAIVCAGVQNIRAQIYDTLPVIVHIINNGESVGVGTNLSQAQVNSQFDVLNEDYRMLNADLSNTPPVWLPLTGDMGLNFDKALVDPNGNPLTEPGIDRISRISMGWNAPPYVMNYIDNTIKPQTIWDPYRYLNIWVMNMGNGLLGYCTFPANTGLSCMGNFPADTLRDGIVVHYNTFGRTGNLQAPYDKGRTATYEIAQWLGLRRLAQVSCGDDCVADTPVGDYGYGGCVPFPTVSSSCNNGPNGDMFMNFLSYVDDSCKVMFTQGQKQRIDTVLTNGTFQSALRLSNVNQPSGIKTYDGFGKVTLAPNPSTGKFSVLLTEKRSFTISILSVVGEKLYETQVNNSEKAELSLDQFLNGIYFIRLSAEEGVHTFKLVLQH